MLLTVSLCRCARGCLLALLAGFWSAGVNADTGTTNSALTIEQAVALTLQHNPTLFQYPIKARILESTRQTRMQSPPLNLELEVENLDNTGAESVGGGSEATLALSSVIELGGDRLARRSVVETRLSLLNAEQQAYTLDVLGDLTRNFIDGLTLQALLELAQEEHELAGNTLSSIEERVNKGAAAETEALRGRAAVISARLRVTALEKKFARKCFSLSVYWGSKAPEFDSLEGSLFTFGKHHTFKELLERVSDSPATRVFSEQRRLQNAELQLARANGRADLSWRIGVQYFEENDTTALTAGISLPLFTRERNSSNLAALKAERELLDVRQDHALLQLHAQLFEAWSLYQQNVETVKVINDELLPQLEQALALTTGAYERGRERYENLASIREQLISAKQMQIEAAGNALNNQATLEQLSGQALTSSRKSQHAFD